MTTIFMAGGEVQTLTKALIDNGVQNILYSYYYILTMKREDKLARIIEDNPQINFFLDSGAFTYYVKYTAAPHLLPPYREYVKYYFKFIDAYGDLFCRVTEPDLDNTLPEIEMAEIDDWREEMLDRWSHKMNVIPVWHDWRGAESWSGYCRDKRIRALAIGRSGGSLGWMRRLVNEAHDWSKPVHGFGMTRVNTDLRLVPFDSVDSISWVTGQKYGTLFVFQNNKFTIVPRKVNPYKANEERRQVKFNTRNDAKGHRRIYKSYLRNIGCDPEKVFADDVVETRKANIIAWKNLSSRLTEMRTRQQRNFFGEEANATTRRPSPHPIAQARPREGEFVAKLFGRPRTAEDDSAGTVGTTSDV